MSVRLGGVHILGLAAIALGALALNATEFYTSRYQTLPVVDWLESRPPLVESSRVPPAAVLVRGLARALPLLTIQDDARPLLVRLGPPGDVQRTIGGVRDAARIRLGSPIEMDTGLPPVQARLDVIVFDRSLRAAGWSELLARALDLRDPENGLFQERVAGPDATDGEWLVSPQERSGGIATIAGHRGPVGFELQVTCLRPGDDQSAAAIVDLSARAEAIARGAADQWTAWLQGQLQAAGVATTA